MWINLPVLRNSNQRLKLAFLFVSSGTSILKWSGADDAAPQNFDASYIILLTLI